MEDKEKDFTTISLRPRKRYVFAKEKMLLITIALSVPALAICMSKGLDIRIAQLTLFFAVLLFVLLGISYMIIRSIRYEITGQQIICRYGRLSRSVNYIELHRVTDYKEEQGVVEQMLGIKTVTVFSTDKTSPEFKMVGIPAKSSIVEDIRERVECNKQRRNVYELSNQN